ncbi:hypothetical protein GDO86_013853 [Hymenochirus boettgeri]|uniref:ADP-ribosylation factor-binding protein GGA3 n=1 Tax=Hymenochirus boettgeri TaxID=247094 RepID=A0A8T2JRX7_9PIPI|nr:hypothetical protein GDO86_013853 [Hymenochirus boettgeri]
MKNCGRRFHSEVGKFRFLNELIKVVSPKYLGDRISEKVKSKVVGLLYSWTLALPEETKIKEAYQMLKRQGIVLSDPVIPVDRTLIPSPPARPKNPIFDDEERSKTLAKLLKSKNPDDLQEANKLIKSMVKEDEVRMQKVRKRFHTLEEVSNNVKLLQEMLSHYSKNDSSEEDKELMKELCERCEIKRLTLFRMASETEDNDSSLGDILQASDNLSRVINIYRNVVKGQDINGKLDPELLNIDKIQGVHSNTDLPTLIDLADSDVMPNTTMDTAELPEVQAEEAQPEQPSALIPILPPPPLVGTHNRGRSADTDHLLAQMNSTSSSLCLLDEELLYLGLDEPASDLPADVSSNSESELLKVQQGELDFFTGPNLEPLAPPINHLQTQKLQPLCPPTVPPLYQGSSFPILYSAATTGHPGIPKATPSASRIPLHELEVLGQQLLEEVKGATAKPATSTGLSTASASVPLRQIPVGVPPAVAPQCPLPVAPGSPLFLSQLHGSPQKGSDTFLSSVNVPLESIKPSSLLPVTAYDKNGFRILLHFAKECPPGHNDILVVVISMLNTAPLPIRNILFQAAVPKVSGLDI